MCVCLWKQRILPTGKTWKSKYLHRNLKGADQLGRQSGSAADDII